jgi:hypothetical protein
LQRRWRADLYDPAAAAAAAARRPFSTGGGGAQILSSASAASVACFVGTFFSYLYFLMHEKLFKCARKSTVTLQMHEPCHNS